jgi:hypothetical protein
MQLKLSLMNYFLFSVFSKVFSTTKEGQMASEEWARWLKTDETRAFAVEEKEEVFKYRSIFAFETKFFSLSFLCLCLYVLSCKTKLSLLCLHVYVCVCACACACVRVRACARVCVCA